MIRFSHTANSWQACVPRTRTWTWNQLMQADKSGVSLWQNVPPKIARELVDSGYVIIID